MSTNIEVNGNSGALSRLALELELRAVILRGVFDDGEAQTFAADFFERIPTCSGLMPHARDVLEYLQGRYRLYILSNGFEELQCRKMRSAGIDGYFRQVILSDHLGVLKPHPQLFHFALSATQSQLSESLMIGDSWANDVAGAAGVGMHQVYYNVSGLTPLPFRPTYEITDLRQLMEIL